MSNDRSYNSPVRAQAKSETRDRILEAVVRVILDDGIHAFTVQTVAERAGVSHRTVYRHFATREELLTGLNDAVYASADVAGLPPPKDVAELRALVRPLFAHFESVRDALRASVIAAVALGFRTAEQERVLESLQGLLSAAYPGLPRKRLTEAAAVLRLLVSRNAWHALSVEMQLLPEPIGRAVSWAVGSLLDTLEQERSSHEVSPAIPPRRKR